MKESKMKRTILGTVLALLAIAVMHPGASWLGAQSPETFTATGTIGHQSPTSIVALPSITITFVINRYTTDAENAALRSAFEQGPAALRAALKAMPDLGSMAGNGKRAVLKYAYKRPNTQAITLLTDEPVAYLDPGADTNKPKEGYDLALAILDFSTPG